MSNENSNSIDAVVVPSAIPGLAGVPAVPAPTETEVMQRIVESTGYDLPTVKMIKRTVAPRLNNSQFEQFLFTCSQYKLNPALGQISPIVFGGQLTVNVNINGLRTLAARTGQHVGTSTKYIYRTKDGAQVAADFAPAADAVLLGARVIVKRLVGGIAAEFDAVAWLDEYYKNTSNRIAQEKPHVMVEKTAEARALRRGFQDQLGSLYEPSEFGQDPIRE